MMEDDRHDQAAMYALRLLPSREALQVAREMELDAELALAVAEYESTAAELIHAAPLRTPPPELRGRVLNAFRREQALLKQPAQNWLTWSALGLAASAIFAATMLWSDNRALREHSDALMAAVAELRDRDTLADARIATLTAKVQAYEKVLAVVVYDQQQQRGLVRMSGLPKPGEGKDYQLWVIEPGKTAPVSAGVMPTGEGGITQVAFKPEHRVSAVGAFAVSVEPKGGSASPRGEVIFVGQ